MDIHSNCSNLRWYRNLCNYLATRNKQPNFGKSDSYILSGDFKYYCIRNGTNIADKDVIQ